MAPLISDRAQPALKDLIDYLPFVIGAWEDPYTADHPEGKILFAVAENKLAFPLLAPALREAAKAAIDDDSVSNYGAVRGREPLQTAIANFLSRHVTIGTSIDPQHVTIAAGTGALLDLVAHILFNPGDVILIPAPYYAAFDNDLVVRAGLRLQPVPLTPGDFNLTEEALNEAAAKAPGPVAGLLLTTPHNPSGTTLPRATMAMAYSWCHTRELHLISDEIYGACCFGGEEGKQNTSPGHVSIAQVCPAGRLGDRTHILWGFSKDFGLSGFRVGALVSENETVNRALDNVALFTGVSGHTQSMLARVLDDQVSIDKFLDANRAALRGGYTTVTRHLRALEVPFVPATAGMFVLCDLRSLLDEPTAKAERAAVQELFDVHGIVLTPGLAQHASEPGWFRLCYAFVEPAVLQVGLDRLSAFVSKRRQLKRSSNL